MPRRTESEWTSPLLIKPSKAHAVWKDVLRSPRPRLDGSK